MCLCLTFTIALLPGPRTMRAMYRRYNMAQEQCAQCRPDYNISWCPTAVGESGPTINNWIATFQMWIIFKGYVFRDKEMEESFQVVRNSCYKAPKMRCLLWVANVFRVQIKGSLIQAHSLLHGHFLGTPPCYADNWSSPSVLADTLTLLARSKTWPWKCILRGKQRGGSWKRVRNRQNQKHVRNTGMALC